MLIILLLPKAAIAGRFENIYEAPLASIFILICGYPTL
jgi:hypothetical protein